MSLPYRQRHCLRRTRRTLRLSEPRLAAMMIMFAKLNAGEAMPAGERVRRRLPGPMRADERPGAAGSALTGPARHDAP